MHQGDDMNKQLVIITMIMLVSTGYVFAADMKMDAAKAATSVVKKSTNDVGNTICPLTGRTLNLKDNNDFVKLEVEGFTFNVCPKGKAQYTRDTAQFADKLAKAINTAKLSKTRATIEVPVEEAVVEPKADIETPVAAVIEDTSKAVKDFKEEVPEILLEGEANKPVANAEMNNY